MSRSTLTLILAVSLLLGLLAPAALWAGDEEPAEKAATPPAATPPAATPPLAAVVNADPVYVGEVDASMVELIKSRKVVRESMDEVRASVLRDIVNRRLIEQSLENQGGYIDNVEVNKQLRKIESKLKEKKMTLADFAARGNVGLEVARHQIVWPMMWGKYLEKHLADELEGYFKAHQKDLDGTQVRASHILLRPEGSKETKSQVLKRAEQLRGEIEAKKITFEEAAEKYSAGPSRRHAGDLGFFPRYGVMTEAFSKAAFALDKGQLSPPITTNFGTHLIMATDVKPGKTQWTEVVPQIQALASTQLFEKVANEQRKSANIEYTGKTAYFKPGTDEVVVPKDAGK